MNKIVLMTGLVLKPKGMKFSILKFRVHSECWIKPKWNWILT